MAQKVKYTQPLFGEANAAGYLIMVPGASVLIRQDGVACDVFADNAGTVMTNPIPTGVPPGTAGVDVDGQLLVFLDAGQGYDGLATVGAAVSTFPISDISPDVADVADSADISAVTAAAAAVATDLAALEAELPGTYAGIATANVFQTTAKTGFVGVEPDGTAGIFSKVGGGLTSQATAPNGQMRLRVSRNNPDPNGAIHFLITPYDFGMHIEYPGQVEWSVSQVSIRGSKELNDNPGLFQVRDENDTGCVFITKPLTYGEFAVWDDDGTSGGSMHLHVIDATDFVEVHQGPQFGTGLVCRLGKTGPGATAGISFGAAADATLYRSAAAALKTDGVMAVGGQLQMGAAGDANLYRYAASILKTDGSLWATGSLAATQIVDGAFGNVLVTLDSTGVGGIKIGTTAAQKVGFFGATSVIQPLGNSDVLASLVTLGLRAASANPPLNLGTGTLTCGVGVVSNVLGVASLADPATNFVLATLSGTSPGTIKIATAATQKIGFYGAAGVVQQTGVAVTAGAIHAALVTLGLITA